MKLTSQRFAIGLLSLATVLVSSSAIAEASPQRAQLQRAETSQRTIVVQPAQAPHSSVTDFAPQIPPRPDNCAPDFSWFDYDAWEWHCVGHW